MKSKYPAAIAILLLTIFQFSNASIFLAVNDRNFEPSQYFDDDMFIGGNSIRFQSQVNGDLMGGSREFVFSGDCNGNINWAAQYITIGGTVRNSVRSFAASIDINASIGRNLIAAGQKISVGPNSKIVRDATLMGDDVGFEGYLGGKLFVHGERVTISGMVEGDANISANTLEIMPNTLIKGNLIYKTPEQIKIPDSAEIRGETRWIETGPKEKTPRYRAFLPIIYSVIMFLIMTFVYYLWVFIWLLVFGNAWVIIITFLALIIGGAVIVALNRNLALRSMNLLEKRFFPSLGLGILVILLFPIASLIAFISFVGWPLGFLLIFAFGTFIFAGAIYAVQFVGCFVARILNLGKKSPSFLGLVLGTIILGLLILIPVVGWIILLVTMASGLGALVLSLDRFKSAKPPSQPESTPSE